MAAIAELRRSATRIGSIREWQSASSDADAAIDERIGTDVINVFIDALGWDRTLSCLSTWAAAHESRYVCLCNVHSVVTASQDDDFHRTLSNADMALPDGMPVAWMLRGLGYAGASRISGPDLMWQYCAMAEKTGQSVYFYGSTDAVLFKLRLKLKASFPQLKVAGTESPPFRPLTLEEDEAAVARINLSGANMLFVGLGCPKQEIWMAEHRGRINAVMAGVGAAFALHAGTLQRAPLWMQRSGLEWLHRLLSEPGRLWKRYLTTNTLFVLKGCQQLIARSALGRAMSEPRRASASE